MMLCSEKIILGENSHNKSRLYIFPFLQSPFDLKWEKKHIFLDDLTEEGHNTVPVKIQTFMGIWEQGFLAELLGYPEEASTEISSRWGVMREEGSQA